MIAIFIIFAINSAFKSFFVTDSGVDLWNFSMQNIQKSEKQAFKGQATITLIGYSHTVL